MFPTRCFCNHVAGIFCGSQAINPDFFDVVRMFFKRGSGL